MATTKRWTKGRAAGAPPHRSDATSVDQTGNGARLLSVEIEARVRAATAANASDRVLETAAMFGLSAQTDESVTIVPRCVVPLPAPGVVFVTGPSGSGKSTVLREIVRATRAAGRGALACDDVDDVEDECIGDAHEPGRALIDRIDRPLDESLGLLAAAGLGEARVAMRSPGELSDGQRARWRLARLFDAAERRAATDGDNDSARSIVLVIDEFGATLDRTTAAILAAGLRRWIDRTGHTCVAATTHDDLLEALSPDVLVYKPHGEAVEVHTVGRHV